MPAAHSLPEGTIAGLAREMYQLLREMQDARAAAPAAEPQRERLATLAQRAQQYAAEFKKEHPRLAASLQKVGERLEALRLAQQVQSQHNGAALRRAMSAAAQGYEGFARTLRRDGHMDGVELPELRPRNYTRNLFHAGNGVMAALLYAAVPDRHTMLIIAWIYTGWMLSLEITRRLSRRWNDFLVNTLFRSIARPSEAHRINSASWFGLAMVVILYLFPRTACIAAVLVLGIGDPAAAIIGRRWGNHRLIGRKSVEGTLGFIAVAGLCLTAFLLVSGNPDVQAAAGLATLGRALALALCAATAGAIAEAASTQIEDNFSIPVLTAAATAGWMSL